MKVKAAEPPVKQKSPFVRRQVSLEKSLSRILFLAAEEAAQEIPPGAKGINNHRVLFGIHYLSELRQQPLKLGQTQIALKDRKLNPVEVFATDLVNTPNKPERDKAG